MINTLPFGRETLERELRKLGLMDRMPFDYVAKLFDYTKLEDLLALIGSGDITGSQISNRVLEDERRKRQEQQAEEELIKRRSTVTQGADTTSGVTIMGTGGLLVKLATCCNPMPGDSIVGYITRGRGVTIHRTDCKNVTNMVDIERLVDVSWGSTETDKRYAVPLEIIAFDREGVIARNQHNYCGCRCQYI